MTRGLLNRQSGGSLDVDHFKQVNDRYRHATSDAVIKILAAELWAELRETDVAARRDGEEFGLSCLTPGWTKPGWS